MSNFSDFFGGGGIKSIQRGVTTPTSDAELLVTVAAVNPTKAMLNLLSNNFDIGATYSSASRVSIRVVNATAIGVTSWRTLEQVNGYLPVSWELIEFA